jgi:precorrin-6y C5,15-methyltransferase (decarboxylating) CbiE subunit
MEMKERPIWIVGCGPGAAEYLTPAARKAVGKAQVIVGAKRLLELFPGGAAERIAVGSDIASVLKEIEDLGRTKAIAVLVTGDPGIFSLARPVVERFGRNRCRVIPGVSSLQAAFARLGLDWHDARIIDAHGEDPVEEPASLAGARKIVVFTGRKAAYGWVERLAESLGGGYRIFLCEDLTLPGETIREVRPGGFLREAPSARSIVIFVRKELIS